MEIYLEQSEKQLEFESHFKNDLARILITSTGTQDYGKPYEIHKKDITTIDEDCEGLSIWWKEWSFLEGKFFNNSAHFKNYKLV